MSDTAWRELTISARGANPETIESELLAAGALAVTLQDGGDQPVLEPAPGETPLWDDTRVTGLFAVDCDMGEVRKHLAAGLGAAALEGVESASLQDRDWIRAWMDDFHPMQFGERLWVVPSHRDAPDPCAVNLLLDPGLAFGTGTHPTTALCLRWLGEENLVDKQMLDYGCGSGILAIAALKLGAAAAEGVDIDPQALDASASNAENNGVTDQLKVFLPESFKPHLFDVVAANILAGPLIELAPAILQYLKPGGRLVLSGILEKQTPAVEAAYCVACTLDQAVVDDGWAMVSGTKKP